MSDIMIPHKAIILACDGMKAQFFRNDGTFVKPDLTLIEGFSEKHPPSRKIGSDRPGRAYSSTGSHRSGVDECDLHEDTEVDFIHRIAARLELLVKDNKTEAVIVAAPPRALGHFRDAVSPAVKAVIIAEVGKDIAGLNAADIAEHITG